MESDSMLYNLSTIIFAILIMAAILILALLLALIPQIKEMIMKKIKGIFAALLFNGLLRSITVSYLKKC